MGSYTEGPGTLRVSVNLKEVKEQGYLEEKYPNQKNRKINDPKCRARSKVRIGTTITRA